MPIGTVAARRAWQPPPPPHTPPPTPAEGFNEMHLKAAKVLALSGIYIYIYIYIYMYVVYIACMSVGRYVRACL